MRYEAPDGIPNLRLPGDTRTEVVRGFYEWAPFPDYPPSISLRWLRARAERSEFARLIDRAIPGDARVVEIGCGTGQMSLYLARGVRVVIGADLPRASPRLGAEAAHRKAWLRDQYQHPEEHRHTLAEVQGWFAENGVEYLRAYPSAMLCEESEELFAGASDNWRFEGWLAQIGWIGALGHEGGLFVTIGRRL